MHNAKPFKIGKADFSMVDGSKLEIVCRITGARMNECSYTMSEELRTFYTERLTWLAFRR